MSFVTETELMVLNGERFEVTPIERKVSTIDRRSDKHFIFFGMSWAMLNKTPEFNELFTLSFNGQHYTVSVIGNHEIEPEPNKLFLYWNGSWYQLILANTFLNTVSTNEEAIRLLRQILRFKPTIEQFAVAALQYPDNLQNALNEAERLLNIPG